jgi:tetratricopeptide (TPR) repeat protein
VRKALELDSDFAEAHSELGTLLRFEPDFAGATKEYELALSLDPSCAVAHHDYGLLLMDLGRTDEALQEFAIATDPLSPNSPWMRLWLLTSLGRMNEAETVYARVTEVDGKGMFWHQARQVLAHARSDTSAVRRELEWFARSSESPVYRLAATAELLLEQGRRDEMPAVMEQIRTGPYDPRIRANMLAELHAKRNELDECFEWIEELTRLHGLEFLRWRLDPDYANVRSDPRYQALLHRLCPT